MCMKKNLLILLLFTGLILVSCAPKGYEIKGEVADVQSGTVFLKIFRNKMFFDVDSAQIVDGKFSFMGYVDQPLLHGLAVDGKNTQSFFLENKKMKVTLSKEPIRIEGSPANDLFLGYAQKVHEPGFDIRQFVRENSSSPVAAFYLYRYFTYQLPLDELKETRALFTDDLENCPYLKDLDLIISRLEKVEIGETAPDFSLPDTVGVAVSLHDFRGQYVLLDFWAAWCPPCRAENPNLVKAYHTYNDKNFTIVGISLDYDRAAWLKAIADDQLTWTHLSDLKYWDSQIAELYGVRGIPANYLLDPDGKIIAKNLRGQKLQDELLNKLGE